jgi:hypothetical protein
MEDHVLRVSEKKVLMRIFGLKREQITAGEPKFHKEKLRNFVLFIEYRLAKSWTTRWGTHVAHAEDIRNAYIIDIRG